MSSSEQHSLTCGTSQTLNNKVVDQRTLGTVLVKTIDKRGSSLGILTTNDGQEFFRNAELKAIPASTWEFLYSYARKIFPQEINDSIFGAWDRPQVAPIVDRQGESRIYRRDNSVSVYSRMMGLNTVELAEQFGFKDEFLLYTIQPGDVLHEARWLGSTTFHFTKDIIEETDWLDPNNELLSLLEIYWREFTRLNKQRIPELRDLLEIKELRRQDTDNDERYTSSISLIKTGHEICDYLRRLFNSLSTDEQDVSTWKETSAQNAILFLLHLYQTNVQQALLWWLGITHGHLHLYNSVSMPELDREAKGYPLTTTLIDFDQANICAAKLAANEELYTTVEVDKVKQLISDEKIDIHLRLIFVMYLPLNSWDQDTFDLVNANFDNSLSNEICELISLRLVDDVQEANRFSDFVELLYKKDINSIIPGFHFDYGYSIRAIKEKPSFIGTDHPNLYVMAVYYTQGINHLDYLSLTSDQKFFLLHAIFLQNRGNVVLATLRKEELKFTLQLEEEGGKNHQYSSELLRQFLESYEEDLIPQLLDEIMAGNSFSRELLRRLLAWAFTQKNFTFLLACKVFIWKMITIDRLNQVIDLVDIVAMDKTVVKIIFSKIIDMVNSHWRLDNDHEGKKAILDRVYLKAEEQLGKVFVWKMKLRLALT